MWCILWKFNRMIMALHCMCWIYTHKTRCRQIHLLYWMCAECTFNWTIGLNMHQRTCCTQIYSHTGQYTLGDITAVAQNISSSISAGHLFYIISLIKTALLFSMSCHFSPGFNELWILNYQQVHCPLQIFFNFVGHQIFWIYLHWSGDKFLTMVDKIP